MAEVQMQIEAVLLRLTFSQVISKKDGEIAIEQARRMMHVLIEQADIAVTPSRKPGGPFVLDVTFTPPGAPPVDEQRIVAPPPGLDVKKVVGP